MCVPSFRQPFPVLIDQENGTDNPSSNIENIEQGPELLVVFREPVLSHKTLRLSEDEDQQKEPG